MGKRERDAARRRRIEMEIVADAYNEAEVAMAWYNYLEEVLAFPFRAECSKYRGISPLVVGEQVDVIGLGPEEECGHEVFVSIDWEQRDLAVPLDQLTPLNANRRTTTAVEDWHYWAEQGR